MTFQSVEARQKSTLNIIKSLYFLEFSFLDHQLLHNFFYAISGNHANLELLTAQIDSWESTYIIVQLTITTNSIKCQHCFLSSDAGLPSGV